MKNLPLSACLVYSLLIHPARALDLVPVSTDATATGTKVTFSISNKNSVASHTFLSDETVKLQFKLTIAAPDQGQSGKLFLLAKFNDAYYIRTPQDWMLWNGGVLQPFSIKVLAKEETIDVLNNDKLPPGEFLIYAGYQREGQDTLVYNATPATIAVFDKSSAALHKVRNKEVLTGYFENTKSSSVTTSTGFPPAATVAPDAPGTSSTDSSASGDSAQVSQTNLQELGVDESDRIKVQGEQLFALENCALDGSKECLSAYQMIAKPAGTIKLGQLDLNMQNYQNGQLYLATKSTPGSVQKLIYLNSSLNYPMFDIWFSPRYWGNNKTEIEMLDVSKPETMLIAQKISINSALISSRMVNNVLYLVTRKNPQFDYTPPRPVALGTTAGDEVSAKNPDVVLVANPKPDAAIKKNVDTLLPTISFDQGIAQPLVDAKDCFVPSQSSDKPADSTLITITAIPVDNPSQYYSVCIAGNVDTFYMSTQAMYLATSRYPYQVYSNSITYSDKWPEMATEIHKFALATGALTYQGSGEVLGHLGWDAEKQPFRMGENNGIFKVATSIGTTWDNSSKTRVAVLQEDANSKSLQEIGHLDNLGKAGEQLYAARFIGNRGYLVTFKQTDPLYVLDFNDPVNPKVLGELHVSGYSDYLHPIGENYLLGIGKDAVVANDTADGRWAWYQGVKLSLYDVSSGTNLKEVNSLIIGKRGTQSAALSDHHALAWLANGTQGTLALPIELHNNKYPDNLSTYTFNYNTDYSLPSAYYDWTHTGLYTFNVDTGVNPGITLTRRLISDVNDVSYYGNYAGSATYVDRAVIQGSSVHYLHNNRVLSAELTQ